MDKRNSPKGLLVKRKTPKTSVSFRNSSQASKKTFQDARKSRASVANNKTVVYSRARKSKKYTSFRDVTKKLSEMPGALELHPTMSAPTPTQVKEMVVKSEEADRTRYFGVPIKMYESKGAGTNEQPEFTDEDRNELQLYGSRVVMDESGRVMGLEVRKDLEHFAIHSKHKEYCQCLEIQYEVAKSLQIRAVRRRFMAKVLMLEAILRMPGLLFIYAQWQSEAVHDFIYQQSIFMCAICALLWGSRLVTISCSKVGRFEPCRSVMVVITSMCYSFNCVFTNSGFEKYNIKEVEINQFEEPISLIALKEKTRLWPVLTFPYIVAMINIHMMVYNVVLSFILIAQSKFMNELKNTFLLVILVAVIPVGCATHAVVVSTSKYNNLWDNLQQVVGVVCACKWTMFRYYALQRVVKGKVMPIDEHMSIIVTLMFAVTW